MTVSENEEEIYKQLNKNRLKLYTILSKKINSDTNDFFYKGNGKTPYYFNLNDATEYISWKNCSQPNFKYEGDGTISLLGAVLKKGWRNTGQWEMVADIKFGQLLETGLILITDANNPFPQDGNESETKGRWGISSWEKFLGTPWTLNEDPHYEIEYEGNGEKFVESNLHQTDMDFSQKWHSLHIKKISSTELAVWLDDNENDKVIYNWEELSDIEEVTFGAVMNPNIQDYDNNIDSRLYIRDLFVVRPYFPSNTLTEFCEDTKKIKCDTNIAATIPPQPTLIEGGNILAINEFNIHNKIQYCNNVLRYTLRNRGIDFTNESNELSNKMRELIKFINQIMTTPTINIDEAYSAYINPIQLLGDKSIVQANETYNLIAEVVDKGAGISIDFMKDDEILATKTTNENGIATYEITGDGSGLNTYYAKSENLKSANYIVIDGVFKDMGTQLDYTDWASSSTINVERSDYTKLTQITSSVFSSRYLNISSYFSRPLCFEFDMVMDCSTDTRTGQSVSLRYGGSNVGGATWTASNMGIRDTNWHHVKIILNENTAVLQLDDNNPISRDISVVPNRFYFILNQETSSSSIQYKNFVIYPIVSNKSLSVSVDNPIISAYHSDTATITATYLENDEGASGKSVVFKKGTTVLDTITTDENGVATYEYDAVGDGDIVITAKCESLSESTTIEDCYYWLEDEQKYVSNYTTGDHSIRFDNNLSLVLTDDFEFSMDCKATMNGARFQLSSISGASSSTSSYGFGFNRDGSGMSAYYRNTSSLAWGTKISYDTNYHSLKFVRDGDTFTAYFDDINKGNQTFTWWNNKSPFSLYWWVWKAGTITAKNIKIKKI